MALSLGFGVVYATLIALLLTPALYTIIEGAKEHWAQRSAL